MLNFRINMIKAIQMGCVYATHLRLTNSSFGLIWARIYYFEARLMVLLQKVDSMRSGGYKESKMATTKFLKF